MCSQVMINGRPIIHNNESNVCVPADRPYLDTYAWYDLQINDIYSFCLKPVINVNVDILRDHMKPECK